MKKKCYIVFASVFCLFLVLSLSLIGCTSASSAKIYEITMGNMSPMESSMNRVVNQSWINWLEKESNGRLKITLMPAAQAAAPDKFYDAAKDGLIDIGDQHMGMVAGRFPLMSVLDLPLIIQFPGSRSGALTCMALYEKYPEIQNEFKDVKVLNFHFGGIGHLHTTKKPVKTMEDINGMVILTVGKGASDQIKALGGSPEPGNPTQIYDLLAKGSVDGMSLNFEGAHGVFHITEITNYATVVGFSDVPFVNVMNLNTWNSLPSDIQKLFTGDNAKRISELYGFDFDQSDLANRDALDKTLKDRGYPGVYTLPNAELSRWEQALLPLREKWVSSVAASVGEAKARAILEDAIKFAKQNEYSTTPFDKLRQTLHDWGAPGY